jgi:YebC/PmpR family DNA-binding regulatory protein
MSGHSKWSTIKRKKGALDAKRSKLFTKVIKEISIAVKEGGADQEANPRLRLAIANAKGINMPKENVLRAINKANEKDSGSFVEVCYEGYAAGGIGIFVECTTDNLLRTVSNVRSYFNKFGGALGKNGSLNFIFDRKGIFVFPLLDKTLEELELDLIDAGAQEIELDEGMVRVTTALEDFGLMIKKLEELNIEVESAHLERIPTTTEVLELAMAKKVLRLVELIEEDDDVQNVYHNLELTDELLLAMDE